MYKRQVWDEIKPPEVESREDFVKAVRASGMVGLGGASFPTHIKYNPQNLDEVDTLIVNGAECEPFITSDHRLMLEDTQDIIDGALIVMKQLDLKKGYIGIEENKQDAIQLIDKMLADQNHPEIKTVTLRARYPQGAERVLVYEITGKTMNCLLYTSVKLQEGELHTFPLAGTKPRGATEAEDLRLEKEMPVSYTHLPSGN